MTALNEQKKKRKDEYIYRDGSGSASNVNFGRSFFYSIPFYCLQAFCVRGYTSTFVNLILCFEMRTQEHTYQQTKTTWNAKEKTRIFIHTHTQAHKYKSQKEPAPVPVPLSSSTAAKKYKTTSAITFEFIYLFNLIVTNCIATEYNKNLRKFFTLCECLSVSLCFFLSLSVCVCQFYVEILLRCHFA